MLQRGDETTWARVTAPGTPYVVGLTVRLPLAHRLETATLCIRGCSPVYSRPQPCASVFTAVLPRAGHYLSLSLTISHYSGRHCLGQEHGGASPARGVGCHLP